MFRKALNGRVTPEKFFEEASVMYDTVNEAYTAMINGLADINESNKKSLYIIYSSIFIYNSIFYQFIINILFYKINRCQRARSI